MRFLPKNFISKHKKSFFLSFRAELTIIFLAFRFGGVIEFLNYKLVFP